MKQLFTSSLILSSLLGSPLRAQDFETEILASTGGMIGGDSSLRYAEIERPVLNLHGDTCFKARVLHDSLSKNAIVKIVDGQSEVIALSGDPVTPWRDEVVYISSAQFSDFGTPAMNDDRRVAFLAKFDILGAQITPSSQHGITLTGETAGEFWVLDRTGRLAKVTGKAGGAQATNSSRHLRLGDPSFDRQGGLYYPSVVQTPRENEPEYRNMFYEIPVPASSADTLSRPDFLFRGDGYLPFSGGSASALPGPVSAAVDSNGDFLAIVQTAEGRRLTQLSGEEETTFLTAGDALPGSAGYVVSNLRGDPGNLEEVPSYLAEAMDGTSSKEVILQGLTSPVALVTSGQAIAGYEDAGKVTDLSEPVATPNGSIAFVATLQAGDSGFRQSVWRKLAAGVEPRPLAIEGQQVPGAAPGVTYRSFGAPIINVIGQVVFPATLNHGYGIDSRNDFAYFLGEPNRVVRRMIGEGDFFFFGWLDLQRIQSLELSAMNEAGWMAVTLRAADGQSALIKVGVPPSSLPNYEDWALTHIASIGERSRSADPDDDGVSNFLEYAHGSDPLDSSSAAVPQMRLLNDEGTRILAMEFNRFAEESELEYHVEFSTDLENWVSSSKTEILISEGDPPLRESVRISASRPPAVGKNFVRIRVTE
ncbi:MAG: hypothetical protein ACJAQT_001964 [Akkermansiaceae bacterium]|jgi:hypothetical protein